MYTYVKKKSAYCPIKVGKPVAQQRKIHKVSVKTPPKRKRQDHFIIKFSVGLIHHQKPLYMSTLVG